MRPTLSLSDWRSDAEMAKWLAELGVVNAPMPRTHLKAVLQFFGQAMPLLPAGMALNFLRATDLSKPVRVVQLKPSEPLLAFRVTNEDPFKLFYTRSGASAHNIGVNPAGRKAVWFKVLIPCLALESYSTGAIDTWTIPADYQHLTVAVRAELERLRSPANVKRKAGIMAVGGGLQLIVPDSKRYLELA